MVCTVIDSFCYGQDLWHDEFVLTELTMSKTTTHECLLREGGTNTTR